MMTISELLAVAIILAFSQATAAENSPPRLKLPPQDTRVVVTEGAKVHLICPVEGDTSLMLFEWLKDRRPVVGEDGKRLRGTNSGTLKFHSAMLEDSGVYTCRVVNGFGSASLNFTLVVEASRSGQKSVVHPQEGNLYPVEDIDTISTHPNRPKFIRVTPLENGVIQRPVGSAVRLKCHAKGDPPPQVVWRRNGRNVVDAELSPGSKRTRYSLQLHDLQETDSGVYTCFAFNTFGSIGTNFTLEVIGVIKDKPELSGPDPENVTVDYGGTAVFKCRVRSKAPPHIKWLKQVSEEDQEYDRKIQNFIPVNDDLYKVLNFSEAVERPDGSFLNKLYISEASERDSGKYICWAANIQGYSYRTAYLTVLPIHFPGLRVEVTPIPRDEFAHSTISLFIIVAVLILVMVILILAYCIITNRSVVTVPFRDHNHEDDVSEPYPKEMSHPYICRSNLVAVSPGALHDHLPTV